MYTSVHTGSGYSTYFAEFVPFVPYCPISICKTNLSTNYAEKADHIQKCTTRFLTEMIPGTAKREVYKDSKIFTMDVNGGS